jgi:hypothetical protein
MAENLLVDRYPGARASRSECLPFDRRLPATMNDENGRSEPEERTNNSPSMAIWIAIGIAIGTAIGVTLDNVAVGIAIGVGIGAALGVAAGSWRRGQ